jgi:hypothetical protein
MQDWNYRYMGCNEVTIELSDIKEPSTDDIPTFWSENRESMLAYIETCLIGVRGVVTDGATGLPLDATVTVAGRDHEIHTDPAVGNYHRMLLPGTYDLTFVTAGYDPLTFEDVVVNAGPAIRLDVVFGGTPAIVSAPNGGEVLPANVPTTVSWTGNPLNEFHVQQTSDYGATSTTTEDFETGSLGPEYVTGGDKSWFVFGGIFHSYPYAARSGLIGHEQETWLTRTVGEGQVSFWYRVSSEATFDFFNFYVDGDRELHVSGEVAWTQFTKVLSGGSHELKWEYVKDDSLTGGSDAVWIDDIEIVEDARTWTDIIALTAPGAMSTPWTPTVSGEGNKVRVRAHYGNGMYGPWDESDSTFTVGCGSPNGDINGDMVVNGLDIPEFIDAVFNGGDEGEICRGDYNGNESLDIGDLDAGLIDALLGM